ncbi:hypothetical protein EYF80_047025 [Liparis tanakae]|uniref:Uncharacterized protein n=1 Tax=Liparis tanakae TaxID=230148 RepID=A0A4Z2FNF0_9TELE|nr:hypothetical protein EYF80_047025 [Liparis tanakae]
MASPTETTPSWSGSHTFSARCPAVSRKRRSSLTASDEHCCRCTLHTWPPEENTHEEEENSDVDRRTTTKGHALTGEQ